MPTHDGKIYISVPNELISLLEFESRRRGIRRSDLIRRLLGYREGQKLLDQVKYTAFTNRAIGEPNADRQPKPTKSPLSAEDRRRLRKFIHFATTPR